MSRAELRQPAVKWQEVQWATAPSPDVEEEESEIVAQFLASPYPYQSDQLPDQDHHELGGGGGIRGCSSSMYWPPAGRGACCWLSSGDSRSAGAAVGGGYFDDGCCYYLGEPGVSLGINTLSCGASIDLNLAGEEEIRSECAHPVPDPSPAVHVHTGYLDDGNGGAAMPPQPKRKKVQAGQEGGDVRRRKKKARAADHKDQGKKKVVSKTVQKCTSSSSSSHCSDNESNCSRENRSAEDHVAGGGGGNAKARAGRGSATDPQSLYAKRRRERINDRLRILQKLVPNGTKVDISTMLEEAVLYVKFLQQQIKMLSSDEMWMYAPIAYNGMSLGIDLRIPLPQ